MDLEALTMAHRSKRLPYSLSKTMRTFALIALLVLIINIVIASVSILNIQRQNHDTVQSAINLYQSEMTRNLTAIQRFVLWTVVREPLVETLEKSETEKERVDAINSIRSRVRDNQYSTGAEFSYCLYLRSEGAYYNASDVTLPWEEYQKVREYIITEIESTEAGHTNFTWQVLQTESETYLYYLISYNNRGFVAIVNVKDMAAPLFTINFGKHGVITLSAQDGNQLYSSRTETDKVSYSSSPFYHLYTFEGGPYRLPFNIHLYTNTFSSYGPALIIQIFIILSALAVVLILLVLILRMYTKAIQPIRHFTEALANIDIESDQSLLQQSNIQELQQTSTHFRNLLKEIDRLKVSVYEKELEKERFQISFLQNQIRPHFYLNCMTTIDSMARLENTKDIRSMVLFVSRYLRYLFHVDKELVRIEYELAHIRDFLDIQALRYGSSFLYDCKIASEDNDALIPPLLLITFVGNIIKHSIPQDEKMRIMLSVKRVQRGSEDFLCIDIIDSGQGFSEEILNKLSRGESLNTTTDSHIGISNSIERLKLLYGPKHSIDFFNEEAGGAHVRIVIPYQLEEG